MNEYIYSCYNPIIDKYYDKLSSEFNKIMYYLKLNKFDKVDELTDINIVNNEGSTLLIEVCKQNLDNLSTIVKYLLTKKININIQNNKGFTALMYAAIHINIKTTGLFYITRHVKVTTNEEVVKMLLDANINPNLQNNSGNTALMIVAFYGLECLIPTIKLLLNKTDLTIKNKLEKNVFMMTQNAKIYLLLIN